MKRKREIEPPCPSRARRHRGIPLASQLKVKEFLGLIPDLVREHLPEELREFHVRGPVFSLVGVYYAEDPRVHYEVWVQRRTGRLELGLHFEADPEANARWLEYFSVRAPDIVAALGPGVEGEQWTASWTRVHESVPLEPLTPHFAEGVAERLGTFISVLEPLRREGEAQIDKHGSHQK